MTRTVVLVGLLVGAACSAPDTPAPPTAAEVTRCIEVSGELLDAIASGLDEAEATLDRGAAVQSADHDDLYFISARVLGSNAVDEGVGTWASSSLIDGVGAVVAVGSLAHSASNWPAAPDGISEQDDGVLASRQCVAR